MLMQILNKQPVIKIEKSFIQAKLRTIAQETQIQEALELCSTDYEMGKLI